MSWYRYGYGFKPYVSVAERRRKAEKEARALAAKGITLSPIRLARRMAGCFPHRAKSRPSAPALMGRISASTWRLSIMESAPGLTPGSSSFSPCAGWMPAN